ncbi:hypothetical protein N9F73_00350 [bacterium]|nr:hypothetical protein [bacterium]
MAPKPQPARFDEGGPVTLSEFGYYMGPVSGAMASSFQSAFEFAQKALTTADPAELGLPEGTNMTAPAELLKDPNAAAEVAIERAVPEEERTGDIKTDLRKAAVASGVEAIPAEAEIDELNKAIFGASLAGAIAGDYVNPNTGQTLRPTAGKRIAGAALQGLAAQRETEERRAKQEATLAAARARATGTGGASNKIPPNLKVLVDIFKKRAETEDIALVAANFNEQYGDNTGTMIMEYIRTGALASDAPDSSPAPTKYPPGSILNQGGNRFRVDDNGVPQLIQGE